MSEQTTRTPPELLTIVELGDAGLEDDVIVQFNDSDRWNKILVKAAAMSDEQVARGRQAGPHTIDGAAARLRAAGLVEHDSEPQPTPPTPAGLGDLRLGDAVAVCHEQYPDMNLIGHVSLVRAGPPPGPLVRGEDGTVAPELVERDDKAPIIDIRPCIVDSAACLPRELPAPERASFLEGLRGVPLYVEDAPEISPNPRGFYATWPAPRLADLG